MENKEVKVQSPTGKSENFYLTIYEYIKQGKNPAQISKELNISKQKLNWYIKPLQAENLIKKIGYGTWIINPDKSEEQVKESIRYACHQSGEIRGHAFIFTIDLNGIANWQNRRQVLVKQGIEFKEAKIIGGGERLIYKGKKVMLTNSSLVIYEPESIFANTSKEAKQLAVSRMLDYVNDITSYLGINLPQIKFKVSRQHYALIKNALAEQYNREGKKLFVRDLGGLWLIIDNSFALNELETIGKNSDVASKKVQDFFNGIKSYEGFTPQFIMTALGRQQELIEGINSYGEHLKSHIVAIQTLGNKVGEFNTKIGELTEVIKQIKDNIEKK